ncbi:MAG: RluA family pseudouridine synthase [Proteobacteria bacterium]|nr:RluA family pseudouridine synthase [Pseudomonadota bacterium]
MRRVVPSGDAGLRLDQALAHLVPELSRARLKSWIDSGRVAVDGSSWEAKRRVRGGETLTIAVVDEPPSDRVEAQPIALAIVHEDDSIIVVDKPAGLVVHPGNGNRDGTLQNALLAHDASLASVPRAGIVHRLDKDTSGLLVIARTLASHAHLVRQLAARSVHRAYLAVVHGNLARAVVIDAPIGRHPTRRTTMAVIEGGRPARTHVDVVERFGDATLVRCRLETGRTHQIRVHLAAAGHPLVGDPAYGSRRRHAVAPAFARQALHAIRLELDHPASGARMCFDAPIPGDLAALIDALRTRGEAPLQPRMTATPMTATLVRRAR